MVLHAFIENVALIADIPKSLLQNLKDLTHQFVPSTSIWRQFVSKLQTFLQQIQVPPAWIDDHPSKGFRLCTVAPLSCLPARSIAQRIFEHVLPCHGTTRQFAREVVPTLVAFQLLQQKYVIQTSLYTVQKWFHSVCSHAEYIPNVHGQEMMWVRQHMTCHRFPEAWRSEHWRKSASCRVLAAAGCSWARQTFWICGWDHGCVILALEIEVAVGWGGSARAPSPCSWRSWRGWAHDLCLELG